MDQQLQNKFEQIADGLAEQSYAVVDSFLSDNEVQDMLQSDEFQNRKLHFRKAGIGKERDKQFNESIRGDLIHWIDPARASAPVMNYVSKLHQLIQYVNQNLFLSLRDVEIHLTAYPVGAFYKRHKDQFHRDDHRKLSVICYLNRGWKEENGGQLRLYLPEAHLDILPEAGKLVCFRSDALEHEVLPATRERFSLTGWMVDRAV
jgi:SM-20-related protein